MMNKILKGSEENRIYAFPGDHYVTVASGKYLPADRLKHYEDIYGPLKYTKYKGEIVINE